MSEPGARRLNWWIGGALAIAVVAAIVLVVGSRLRLNDDERFLVGRWEIVGQEFVQLEFQSDGSFTQHFEGAAMNDLSAGWCIHGNMLYIDEDPSSTSRVERAWTRLIGGTPTGVELELEMFSETEIELDGTELRRVE